MSEQCGESLCESTLAVGLARGRACVLRPRASKTCEKTKAEVGQSSGRALSDGAATTHLRLWRREADLEGKGTDGGREHSRLRFCDVIAREGESVIGLRYEMTIEVEKPERNLPSEILFFRLHVDDMSKVC